MVHTDKKNYRGKSDTFVLVEINFCKRKQWYKYMESACIKGNMEWDLCSKCARYKISDFYKIWIKYQVHITEMEYIIYNVLKSQSIKSDAAILNKLKNLLHF